MRATDPLFAVTGATGFIGHHLAQRLIGSEHRLRVLVRDPRRLTPRISDGAEIIMGDLARPESLCRFTEGADILIHCAANVQTWDCRAHYEATNVHGVAHLLDAVEASTRKPRVLIHLSTVDVYGFPNTPCDENCLPRAPGFGYGDSKLQGEALFKERASALGIPWVVLRPCNVMGPGSPFIDRIGQELHHGLMLQVDGGHVDAGFLDVDHLVSVILWATSAEGSWGEVFNVNGPERIEWRRFLIDLRRGVAGKGVILSLPYALAMTAGHALAMPYNWLRLPHEPLLHPLIVQIFGRSCGHFSDKLQRFGAPPAMRSYAEVMAQCIAGFRGRAARRGP